MSSLYPPTQRLEHSADQVDRIRVAFGWDQTKETNYGFPDDVDAVALFDDVEATLAAIPPVQEETS